MEVETKQVLEFLSRHDALLIHFSTCPRMSNIPDADRLFPHDLRHVIDGNAQSGIACSTVNIDDAVFPEYPCNTAGSVGVVIKPKSLASITAATAEDSGSHLDDDGARIGLGTRGSITLEDLEKSMANRPPDSYNEWHVKDYDVVGVFCLSNPVVVQRLSDKQRMRLDSEHDQVSISPHQVAECFVDQRLISRAASGHWVIYETKNGERVRMITSAAEIYGIACTENPDAAEQSDPTAPQK